MHLLASSWHMCDLIECIAGSLAPSLTVAVVNYVAEGVPDGTNAGQRSFH
jgi:hypothetical protein